ncbi:MAG TPA: response regulator [Microvirga sp.]|jgi:CheY-like chemotaxis protein|nr:response regulator [Microvirga sp.]
MVRILYVEDNEDNIYMLQNRLRRQGFDVLIARDGASGVELAKAERPDLILMDLGLPVMDGWEASRRLKSDDTTSSIPVIALSAHAMSNDKAEALAAGCDEYDVKPVEWGRLLTKIRALLPPGATS